MEITASISNVLQALLVYPSTTPIENNTRKFRTLVKTENCKKLQLPEITLDEVSNHDSCDDCWIVIYDRVYNVTNFLRSHPGGEHIIMEHAGRDGTLAFHGTGHSQMAIAEMQDYLIGELPAKQRILCQPCEMDETVLMAASSYLHFQRNGCE